MKDINEMNEMNEIRAAGQGRESGRKTDSGNEQTPQLSVRPLQKQDPLMEDILRLYHDSFPDAERKPFSMIEEGVENGQMEAWIAQSGQQLAALAFVILGSPLHVLDYLAVHPDMRGQNVGSQVLHWLDEQYDSQPIVVEIETTKGSEDQDVHRRKAFYLRNGFYDCGCDFDLFGVRMEMLSTDRPVNFREYYSVMKEYFGKDISRYIQTVQK